MPAFEGSSGRLPPHNLEAETATLGAILVAPDKLTVATVLRYLRADDFYRPGHRKIFQALINLSDRNDSIDLITLTNELKEQGELAVVGGPAYVAGLTSAVPSSANVEYYAKIVQECSVRRRLIKIAADINERSFDSTRESRQVVEDAQKEIFEITYGEQAGDYQPARQLVKGVIETIERYISSHESYTGVPTDFTDLDNLLSGFQKSEFIIIGARPSIGKTALALCMAANIAIRHKRPVGFFTLEMSSQALIQRLLSSEARVSSQAIRTGILKPSDMSNLMNAAALIYDAPLFINDTPGIRLLDLKANARRMKAQENIQILFVDYITLIGSEHPELPRHEQIAEISRSLKALARELDLPVVVLSQVSRDAEGHAPTLANIRESGSIEQDADVVLFLHRERGTEGGQEQQSDTERMQVIVAKQRNGPVGDIELAFHKRYTSFANMEHHARM